MKPLYAKDRTYQFLKKYVDAVTRLSYSKIRVRNLPALPKDCAVLIAPNHCNALMDPLVILQTGKRPIVFGARADAFTPVFRKALRFLKIVPMVRVRDGLRNVVKNRETMAEIIEVLRNGVPFCMFCEGTHRTSHSLLPLTKGIFRTAFEADAAYGKEMPVYIAPVGIEYGDYFRYRSSCVISFGEPINVSSFVRERPGVPENDIYLALREELAGRMKSLITYIPSDEDYDAKWVCVKVMTASKGLKDPEKMLDENRKNAACLEKIEDRNIFHEALQFERLRKDSRVSFRSFGKKPGPVRIILKCLSTLIILPYIIYCAAASLPALGAAEILRMKVEDKAFCNTARIGCALGIVPLTLIVIAIIFFSLLNWKLALILTAAAIPSFWITYDYAEYVRTIISDIRLAMNRTLRERFDSLRNKLTNNN